MDGVKEMNMGNGLDMVRAKEILHTEVLDDFKDQLLICLLKKLANSAGRVSLPAVELDATGRYSVAFRVIAGNFDFTIRKKD